MRNRFVIAGLLLAAGLFVGPAADHARAQPTAWDVAGREAEPVWAPIGTYQHDGSGIYFGTEALFMHSPRSIGSQTIAVRGVFFNIGSPGLPTTDPPHGTGVPMIEQGSFLGDRTLALDTSSFGPTAWSAGDRLTLGYRLENGWNFSISWLHLFGVKYSAAAGMLGPDMLNPASLTPTASCSPPFTTSQWTSSAATRSRTRPSLATRHWASGTAPPT